MHLPRGVLLFSYPAQVAKEILLYFDRIVEQKGFRCGKYFYFSLGRKWVNRTPPTVSAQHCQFEIWFFRVEWECGPQEEDIPLSFIKLLCSSECH